METESQQQPSVTNEDLRVELALGACEVITCSPEGERALREAPPWE